MQSPTETPFAKLPPALRRHVYLFQGHQFLDRFAMGVSLAVTALALQGRGLGLADISALFAIYSAVTLTAELPFGGLADGLGRKPVFLLATGASLLALAVFILSGSFAPLALSFALVGLGRALRSGTLDAWFVEGVYAQAPGLDLQPLLARAQMANFAGLGAGAILGGFLPGLVASNAPSAPLIGWTFYDVSYAAGLGLTFLVLLYTVVLIREPARALNVAVVLREIRAVPGTIRDGVGLAISHRTLLLLLALLALLMFATNPVEVLWPTVVRVLLEPERAALTVGLLTAGYFLALALGAGLAGRVSRLLGRHPAVMLAAVLGVLVLCQILLALQGALIPFVATFLVFSLVLGLSDAPSQSILHAHVPDRRRSTLLSVQSLIKQLGAMAGLLALGPIGEAQGMGWAWGVGALGLVGAAGLAVLLARQSRP